MAVDKGDRDDRRVCNRLRAAGLQVSSVYDLVNTSKSYPEAIPALLSSLDPKLEANVLEGVVRALTVKEAKGIAAKPLIDLIRELPAEDYDHVKDAIGNALSVVAEDSDFEPIAVLVKDDRHQAARIPLTETIGRMDDPRRSGLLMKLLQDEEWRVVNYAIRGLRRAKAAEARSIILPLLDNQWGLVRQEAKRAIAAFDRESAKNAETARLGSTLSRRKRSKPHR